MQLELDPAERELLIRVLDLAMRETRTEVRHTETASYRTNLKAEEKTMVNLLERLRAEGT